MTPRKPPHRSIQSIRGEFRHDLVTDADYQRAVDAQDAALFAEGVQRKVLGQIRSRLVNGARDGGKKYYFDTDRGIVRRREQASKQG